MPVRKTASPSGTPRPASRPGTSARSGSTLAASRTRRPAHTDRRTSSSAVQRGAGNEPREAARRKPSTSVDVEVASVATFGAGCFWGVEVVFRRVPGVLDVVCGYAGGQTPHPTYEEVCTDATGHAEVVQITFDPRQVTYRALLDVFFDCHDPTQHNRQGDDIGSQYRSVIFYHSPQQQREAKAAISRRSRSGRYTSPVVTSVEPASTFYPAETYHQRYLEKRGLASCHLPPSARPTAR